MPSGVYERKSWMRSQKLTQDQRDVIKMLAGDKMCKSLDVVLGELFGVSRYAIHAIRRGWWTRRSPVGGKKAVGVAPEVYLPGQRVGEGSDHDDRSSMEKIRWPASGQPARVVAKDWSS